MILKNVFKYANLKQQIEYNKIKLNKVKALKIKNMSSPIKKLFIKLINLIQSD